MIAKRIRIDPKTGEVTEEEIPKDDDQESDEKVREREDEKRGVYRGFGQYL